MKDYFRQHWNHKLGTIFKQSCCRGPIEQKRLKTTGLYP